MVNAVIKQKSHFLGPLPAHAKFEVVKLFTDGSYKSWIAPDGESKKKGATRIPVRIIEYIIEENGTPKTYRNNGSPRQQLSFQVFGRAS